MWKSSRSIAWEIRVKVALGAARGLAFLHDDQTQVIFRDLKTANILLDDVSFSRVGGVPVSILINPDM